MNLKKALQIVALILISFGSFAYAIRTVQNVRAIGFRLPSILVVSFCSLRSNLLSHYGGESADLMPNIEKFFRESSFVMDNVINGLSWTGLFGYARMEMEQDFFAKAGYDLLGLSENRLLIRVPLKKSWDATFKGQVVDNSDFEKDIKATFQYVEDVIKRAKDRPSFLVAHIKYLHYPLIDRFNSGSGWDYFLNAEEKARINDYLSYPAKYYQKLPFLLLLANNPRHALEHPRVKAQMRSKSSKDLEKLLGLMTNPEYLAEWKASEDYADDLRLLDKIYRGNARYLDTLVKPILNLYDDKTLQNNTIVFFTGDHGEMHMERDELTHGLSIWDQAIKVPFAVKFPDSYRHRVINEQLSFVTVAKIIRKMIEGKSSASDFSRHLATLRDDVVLGRDCNNTVRGLRYKNKYKYFATLGDSGRFLFDLQKDPKELHNLASEEPAVVSEMETLYWKNYDRFSTSSDPYAACAPWTYSESNGE